MICGPIFDANTEIWRRRYNRELHELIEMRNGKLLYQRTKDSMHHKDNNLLRTALKWVPQSKRLHVRSKNRLDGVEDDLENWKDMVQDRDMWRDILGAAKALRVVTPEEE